MASPPTSPGSRSSRRKGPAALSDLVPEAVAPILKQRGFATTTILTEWAEIVGRRLAKWCSPIEIRWPRRPEERGDPAAKTGKAPQRGRAEQATRATLLVAAPGAFALEIQMASASIIEAVNRRLGFGCIGVIQIVQAPRPAPVAPKPPPVIDPKLVSEVENGLGDIRDDEMRKMLAELGAAIASRTPKRPG